MEVGEAILALGAGERRRRRACRQSLSGVGSLAEDNRLQYALTTLNRKRGHFETVTITKAGPTGLLTTSTRALPHQLNTRLLPVRW